MWDSRDTSCQITVNLAQPRLTIAAIHQLIDKHIELSVSIIAIRRKKYVIFEERNEFFTGYYLFCPGAKEILSFEFLSQPCDLKKNVLVNFSSKTQW